MEQSICNATAIAFQYNLSSGQWAELGSESGSCNISILKSPTNEYRFVAWKTSSHEVVLNSFIFPALHYDATTPIFHQWYDEAKVAFGLHFIDPSEAKKFGIAVGCALEALNDVSPMMSPSTDGPRISKKTFEFSPKVTPPVSPYAVTGINLTQNHSFPTPMGPTGSIGRPSEMLCGSLTTGLPPVASSSSCEASGILPSGPPPPGPPPPAPPPLGPSVCVTVNNSPKPVLGDDFATELKTVAENMRKSKRASSESLVLSLPPSVPNNSSSVSPGPIDFLSELKLKSKNRNLETSNSTKKFESLKITPAFSANKFTKSLGNQCNKFSNSTSDLSSTSTITSADLEKFRNNLMKDILSNMEKMKDEIISSILAKLN